MMPAFPFQPFTSVTGHSLLILYIWKVKWNSCLTSIIIQRMNILRWEYCPIWGRWDNIFLGILSVRYNLLLANIHACMSHTTERAEVLIQKFSLADWCRCICRMITVFPQLYWRAWKMNNLKSNAQDCVDSENVHPGKNMINSRS